MSESLVLRVKRLVSGSVNGLVDALETANSEMVMREAIREIDRAIEDVRDELGHVIAARHQTLRLVERTKQKLVELDDRAKLAVQQNRDDLAEAALSRQLDLEADVPTQELRIAELLGKQTELDGYISSLELRKRQMEADIAAFVAALETAEEAAGVGSNVASGAERRADKAQAAFERAMSGPAGGSANTRMDRETSSKLHELDRLDRSSKVADRLASLKRDSKLVG